MKSQTDFRFFVLIVSTLFFSKALFGQTPPPDPTFEIYSLLKKSAAEQQSKINAWKSLSPSRKYLITRALIAHSKNDGDQDKRYDLARKLSGADLQPDQLPANKVTLEQKRTALKTQVVRIKSVMTSGASTNPSLTIAQRNTLIGDSPIQHSNRVDVVNQQKRFVKLLDNWFPIGKSLDELKLLIGSDPTFDNKEYWVSFDGGFGGLMYAFTVENGIIVDFRVVSGE